MLKEAEMKEQEVRARVRVRKSLMETHKKYHGEKITPERRIWDWTIRSNIIQASAKWGPDFILWIWE